MNKTPEQEAEELIEKHYTKITSYSMAKQCALITVDKLISEARKVSKIMYEVANENPFDRQLLYWQKVRAAIESKT